MFKNILLGIKKERHKFASRKEFMLGKEKFGKYR